MKNIHKGILYVDDEPNNLASFKAAFRKDFYIYTAESADEAKSILTKNYKEAKKDDNLFRDIKIKVIVADQRMPNMTGIEFFESIINDYPDPIRLLVTGYSDTKAAKDAINIGKVYHYMTKPWSQENLKNVLTEAYDLYQKQHLDRKTITRYTKMVEVYRPPR
ncbi:MAG: response regulator [Flavobacteriales bacterium]|nr:response regulator [Flavobacteriales bacterium]